MPGVPRGDPARRGAHACTEGEREGSGAGVLCGGDSGYAEVGDWGGWGCRVWATVKSLGLIHV